MTQEQTQPSPGALRAAAAICEYYLVEHRSFTKQHRSIKLPKLAELIDRETAAPDLSETVSRELLAALEGILFIVGNVKHETETGPRDALCRGGMLDTIRELAQGPVAKAKGELQ